MLAIPPRAVERGPGCCEPGVETILGGDAQLPTPTRDASPFAAAREPEGRIRGPILSTGTDATPTGLPRTDPEALARLERFGGRKLLHEMIALYLRSAPERLSAAAAGVAARDAAAAENALHALKSSSAQLGANRLSRLCEEGEAIARAGMLESVEELVEEGREELRLVQAWLDGVRSRPSS